MCVTLMSGAPPKNGKSAAPDDTSTRASEPSPLTVNSDVPSNASPPGREKTGAAESRPASGGELASVDTVVVLHSGADISGGVVRSGAPASGIVSGTSCTSAPAAPTA